MAHAEQLAAAFRKVDKLVEPSVVKIEVRKKGPAIRRIPFNDDMLRRFFPDEEDLPEGIRPRGMAPDEEDITPDQIGTGQRCDHGGDRRQGLCPDQ